MSHAHKASRAPWGRDAWCRAQYGAVVLVFAAALVLGLSRLAGLLSA